MYKSLLGQLVNGGPCLEYLKQGKFREFLFCDKGVFSDQIEQ